MKTLLAILLCCLIDFRLLIIVSSIEVVTAAFWPIAVHAARSYTATPTVGGGTVDVPVNDSVTCDGVTNATSQMLSVVTRAGRASTKLIFTTGKCVLSTMKFPDNVSLDLTRGDGIQVITGETVTIMGPVIAPRRRIFHNALASQGTVAFAGNTHIDVFYPEWWGAAKDGSTNDLPVLQATTDAADTTTDGHGRNGATIDLGIGTYYIGSGTWKVGTTNTQHHLNVTGQSVNGTMIETTVLDPDAAIYLNLEKYVTISNFSLKQVNGVKRGYGMQLGGGSGAGTQTNGSTFSHIYFNNFHFALSTSGGKGTSSELVFNQLDFEDNAYGFYSANFNGLNYLFNMVEMYGNSSAGIDIEIGNLTVIGGASNGNGEDFHLGGGFDQTVKIVNFRSEMPKGYAAEIRGCGNYSVEESIFHSNPGQELIWAICNLSIMNTTLDGSIRWQAQAYGLLQLDHVTVNMPGGDWSLTNQLSGGVYPFGPGFRLMNNQGSYAPPNSAAQFSVKHVYNSAIRSLYPDVDGLVTHRPTGYPYAGWNVAVAMNTGYSTDPLTIVGNAIIPYAFISHINGSGLIKNIKPPIEVDVFATCLVFIPDQPFSTDTTGNIAKVSRAVVNQAMTVCKDRANGKWYPSY